MKVVPGVLMLPLKLLLIKDKELHHIKNKKLHQEQGQEARSSQGEVLKRKPSKIPSNAWVHFTKQNDRLLVTIVKKSYATNNASHATTNMLKHLKACLKNPYIVTDKKQEIITLGRKCYYPNTIVR